MAAASVIGLLVVALGCGGARGTGAASPERQSETEFDLARELFLRGDPRGALEHAKLAIELDDENADAQHLAALIYLWFCASSPDECRLGEAEKHARAALAERKDFREARNTLGVILIHQKRYDEAITVLKALTEDILYKTPEQAWGNLGLAYLEKGETDLAIEALKRSIAAEPRFCTGSYRLGLAYEKKGDWEAARKAFTRVFEVDLEECRNLQEAWEARGRASLATGDCEGARRDWERCLEIAKETPTGQRCEAQLDSLSC